MSVKECYEKGLEHDPEHSGAWSSLGSIKGGLVNGKPSSAKECYILSPSSSVVGTDLFIIARGPHLEWNRTLNTRVVKYSRTPPQQKGFFVGLRLCQPCELQTNFKKFVGVEACSAIRVLRCV